MVTKKNGQAYSDEFKAKLIERVKAGEPVSKVAASSGVHFGTIYAWMKTGGIKPRHADKVGGAAVPAAKGELINVRDTLLYLRHARAEILKETANSGKMSRAHLLTLLALDTLQGE